jgi:DNA repair protein RadD
MKQLRNYQTKALTECLDALKETDEPVLLMASVGAGKSIILAELLLIFEKANKRALCIVNNAELVRNNAQTFKEQGGSPSIYCAALKQQDCSQNVVFGTPQSVLNGIKKNEAINSIKFNIILVDEAHAINYKNHQTTFMRILRHYKQEYPAMRVLGATGTAFRYKGEPIVGDECLFKKQVGNISTAWLIDHGFLVNPKFEVDSEHTIDFSKVKLNQMGKFDTKQLESVIEKNQRLTGKILSRLQSIMESQSRFGCFIFCSTLRHCAEAMQSLPEGQAAIITGSTPQSERIIILDKARRGEIKYLVNVQVLTVGIDVPGYDTLVFLRPTESLVLAVQMIGRALRLYPGKNKALIIDCAGNIERHSDWDDPVMLEAIKQTRDYKQELIFPCPTCETMNSQHARRCVGVKETKRCNFYFEWKDCPLCSEKNDIVCRECRKCGAELIDPNAKLSEMPFIAPTIEVDVLQSKFWIQESGKYLHFRASYQVNENKMIYESYAPMNSDAAKNIFWGNFVKKHLVESSFWYPHLKNPIYLKAMLQHVQPPVRLKLKWDSKNWKIMQKFFPEPDSPQ